MRLGGLALVLAVACAVLFGARDPARVDAQSSAFNIASESYYRLDVPNGTASARVEAVIQSAGTSGLKSVQLWAMPGAQNLVVKQCDGPDRTRCDTPLETKALPLSTAKGLPTLVTATLARPLLGKTKLDLVMTYDVPAQATDLVRMEPGSIEALFVSQGEGSFVFIDVPGNGDNVFEPGCLKAAGQPVQVREAGMSRWICGDATVIALNTEDKGVQERCANADDKCRQRVSDGPFSAFAQSVTDPGKLGVLEADVPLKKGPVKLQLRYFRRDQAWADAVFAVAKDALPKIEEVFGFPYSRDTLVMKESYFIGLAGASGIAFSEAGQVLVSHTPVDGNWDKEVVVHELSHQWAGLNLSHPWLWEGLAEYSTRSLAVPMGLKLHDRKWESFGYKDALATWHEGSAVTNPDYWYGKAGAFFLALEKAAGGREKMTAILGMMDDDPSKLPLDGRWLIDRSEEVSGANLDELFLTWVFRRETATPLFKSRRAAHDLVARLTKSAADLGLTATPKDIRANLDIWEFGAIEGQVTKADQLLGRYQTVLSAAQKAGLPASAAVLASWGENTLSGTAATVEDMRLAVDAILSAQANLGEHPDAKIRQHVDDAIARFAAGDLAGARELASKSVTDAFNQEGSGRMIALAKETQAKFKPGLFGRVGVLLKDPDGELAAAEKAYAAGDFGKALELSRGAHETWSDADRNGVMRLAIAAALMCGLTCAAWWLIRRLDPANHSPARQGHALSDPSERRADWSNHG